MGELTVLPRHPSWIWGKGEGVIERAIGEKGNGREGMNE